MQKDRELARAYQEKAINDDVMAMNNLGVCMPVDNSNRNYV